MRLPGSGIELSELVLNSSVKKRYRFHLLYWGRSDVKPRKPFHRTRGYDRRHLP